MSRLVIQREDELSAALDQAKDRMGFTNNSDEEREMAVSRTP